MGIETLSKLSFFAVNKYHYQNNHTCDFRNIPRPHFCMGLLLEGTADFTPEGGKSVHIEPGDIIFVPITSRYISKWVGSPDIVYISMHFTFEPSGSISERQRYRLQKITLENFESLKELFSHCLENYNSDEASQMKVLSKFFGILGEILPQLHYKSDHKTDESIEQVLEYISLNSERSISVSQLAAISNMSLPNFYVRFKKYTSKTPIEYKNEVSVARAIQLLKSEKHLSVEQISNMLGFESSTYFRRVFKKITGNTPVKFRKSNIEL